MDRDLLSVAGDHFGSLLAGVDPQQWGLPTPCAEWAVADLVDHVVGGNRWATLVLGGVGGLEALKRVRGASFGVDRPAEYAASMVAQFSAFRAEGALDKTVDHLVGVITGAQFLPMRIADLTVHAWDLARATSADERLPDELVQTALAYLEPLAAQAGPMSWFGVGPQGAPRAATAQQRLLHLTGRRP